MNNKKKGSGLDLTTRRIIANIVLIFICFLCLIWFYILFVNASRSKGELTKGFSIIPSTHLIENLKGALTGTQPFMKGMLNSVFVSFASAALCTYFSAMTAYGIHAYTFKLKKPIYAFILAIMMIPSQVTALSFIRLVTKMNMMNTYTPLIIPSIAAPATFFYMKQYMDSVLPLEIIEAARIDGSGEFRTFNTIILPIMRPAIAVQAIFTLVSSWNNYFTPSLVLTKEEEKKTLPILIAELRSADFLKFNMGHVYAAIAFSIFPVMLIYLVLSKNIVGGVAMGAVKG